MKDACDLIREEASALGYAGMQAKYGPSHARTGDSGERYIWIAERNLAVRYRLDQIAGWVYCGLWNGRPPHMDMHAPVEWKRMNHAKKAKPQEGAD